MPNIPIPITPAPLPLSDREIVFSIHLNSNRPEQIIRFIAAIEQTATSPAQTEVLIHIDAGDDVMEQALTRAKEQFKVQVKWFATDLIHSFADTWKPYNLMLEKTAPTAYFLLLLSDEMLFTSAGWDDEIKRYIGYFPDHIFRLRASQYRHRNYTDAWECGFAPDSIAFTTRRWLEIQGDWNPCNGPDSFQQCVSYYLSTSEPFNQLQYHRDLVHPFLRFSGEGVSVGMDEDAHEKRVAISTRLWFTLFSHRYQQEAKRRAALLKAHIIVHKLQHAAPQATFTLQQNTILHTLNIMQDGGLHRRLKYGLFYPYILLKNLLRAPLVQYYGGGGKRILRTHPMLGFTMLAKAYIPGYIAFIKKKNAFLLVYYRWRNTKLNHVRGHLQRFPKIYRALQRVKRWIKK